MKTKETTKKILIPEHIASGRKSWWSSITTDIVSDMFSGIYSDILSGTISGINSDILSDILPGIYSDILSGILDGIYSVIYYGILFNGIYSDIFLASILAFYLASSI